MLPSADIKVFRSFRKDGRFTNAGLRGRRLGPGRYRFFRQGKGSVDSFISAIVTLAEPWASERTMVPVLACARHGDSCPGGEQDPQTLLPCEMRHVLVQGPRWLPVVSLFDRESVIVMILRYPKAATVAGALRSSTFQDADFALQVIVRE